MNSPFLMAIDMKKKEWIIVMQCPKCKSKNLDVVDSGPHKKLVCIDCLTYIKFLKKSEYKTYLQLKAKNEIETCRRESNKEGAPNAPR